MGDSRKRTNRNTQIFPTGGCKRRSRNLDKIVKRVREITRMCSKNIPVVTQYQEEISRGATIGNAPAGRVANEEIQRLMEMHKAEITQLMQSYEEAIRKKDEETRHESEEERGKLDETLATLRENIHPLNISLQDEKQMGSESMHQYKENYQNQEESIKKLEEGIQELEERLKHETNPRVAEQLRKEKAAASKAMKESMISLWNSIY